MQEVINESPCGPDAAQREYLRFVMDALDLIVGGVDARKALGLSEGGRRSRKPPWPMFRYFFWVGLEYSRQPDGKKSIKAAKQAVADRYDVGFATVEKSWTYHGSFENWKRCFPEELENPPPLIFQLILPRMFLKSTWT